MSTQRILESEGFSWLNNPLPNIDPYSIYKENVSMANHYSFGMFGQRYLESYNAKLQSLLKIRGAETLPTIDTVETWQGYTQTYKSSIFINARFSTFPFFDLVSKANSKIKSKKDIEWTLILEGVSQSKLVNTFELNNALKGAKPDISPLDKQRLRDGRFFMVTETFCAEKVLIFALDFSKRELCAEINSLTQFEAKVSLLKQEKINEEKFYNKVGIPLVVGVKLSRIKFDDETESYYLDDPKFEHIRGKGDQNEPNSCQGNSEIFIL